MSILVTGGAGFLGNAFAIRARDGGHHVVIADRLPGADIALDASDTDAIAAAEFVAAEAQGVERAIYASSISAAGRAGTHDGDDQRLAPGNVDGATKSFCEHLAQAMGTRTGAPGELGLRFGYV